MITNQAPLFLTILTLLAGLAACSPINQQTPTPTVIPLTPTSVITFTPSPIPSTPTPTPLACLSQPGQVKQDSITSEKPSQDFLIYLPPCYDEMNKTHYPVLYLLHGQGSTEDQWVGLGAVDIADELILSGEVLPFIIVFPDDHYWNLPAGPGFGERMINLVIPYVDKNYRTLADRAHRSIGGLSRGGGWTIHLGFTHPELFGSLGLHSPAVKGEDAPYLENIIQTIPLNLRPRLWFDIGDADKELGQGRALEAILTNNNYLHEFHLYAGDHTEGYWRLHVDEYLRWYVEGWSKP
jgi:enterochelin esterase-like enzyme